MTAIVTRHKAMIRIAILVGLLLLVPVIGMQVSDEWQWDLFDFVCAGLLLFGTGLAYEMITRQGETIWYRAGVGVGLAAGLVLVWMNAAVGLIGDKDNLANPMYVGVLAVGIVGAALARFEPHGMARALFATALAQALVPVIALGIWPPRATSWAPGVLPVCVLHAMFAMLFAGSALLFRRADATRKMDA